MRPLHGSLCFAGIPGTVARLLGAEGEAGLPPGVPAVAPAEVRAVVLLLVDGFGWSAFMRHAGHPFLRRLAGEGTVVKLTSQFPSTTTAHLTTLWTGLPVGETGLYEWFLYEPSVGEIVCPLMWSYAGDARPGTLGASVSVEALLPFAGVAEPLAAAGVALHAVQPKAITGSPYGRVAQRGANAFGYRELAEGLRHVAEVVARPEPAYAVVYVDAYDSAAHRHGPSSPAADAAAVAVLDALEAEVPRIGGAGDVLVLFAADHGLTDVDTAETIYVNREWPALEAHLRRSRSGRPLAPAGSARDLFLHVEAASIPLVVDRLGEIVGDRGEVHRVVDLVAAGLFGPVAPRFLERVGDVVVLPYAPATAWWHEPGRFEMSFSGHHGGMEPEEMHTALGALVR